MIGELDSAQKEVTVVGAGISGLLFAYALKKRGYRVTLLEASARAGGIIDTVPTPFGPAEKAAHSLLVTPEMKAFFEELQVPLDPVNPNSKARYIYRNGKMRKMPLRFFEIIRTAIAFFSKPRIQFNVKSGTLEEWGDAYVGSAATRYLLSPFVTGIFATSPKELLARIAFPKLIPVSPRLSLFRHFRTGGKSPRPVMMAPRHGMKSLIDTLTLALRDELKLNSNLQKIPDSASQLVLAVPTSALSVLINDRDHLSATALDDVRYAPLITVTCFYKKSAFQSEPCGVGVLIPRGEGIRMLGCLFNSSSFPNRTASADLVSLTTMYGGTEDPAVFSLTDGELSILIHKEIHQVLGSKSDSVHLEITRWNRAIPIYGPELDRAQNSLKSGLCAEPGTIVFTNFSKEVSIRGLVNATLHL